MSDRDYEALRATVRTREIAKPLAFLAGISTWAALLIGTLIWLPNPLASTVPLVVLLAAFEAVRSLASAREGAPRSDRAIDEDTSRTTTARRESLFLPVFVLATFLNFLAVVFPGPLPIELIALAAPHLALVVWVIYCDVRARRRA